HRARNTHACRPDCLQWRTPISRSSANGLTMAAPPHLDASAALTKTRVVAARSARLFEPDSSVGAERGRDQYCLGERPLRQPRMLPADGIGRLKERKRRRKNNKKLIPPQDIAGYSSD